jgi:hypothetical protein
VPPVGAGVAVDVLSNSSYFKFNLDYMSLYQLVHLQDNSGNPGRVRDAAQPHVSAPKPVLQHD